MGLVRPIPRLLHRFYGAGLANLNQLSQLNAVEHTTVASNTSRPYSNTKTLENILSQTPNFDLGLPEINSVSQYINSITVTVEIN